MATVKSEIAEKGMTFRNMFVTDPVCGPSRASILTGRYPHNHGLIENRPPNGGYKRFVEGGNENSNVAIWLKAAGYRTALIGKYLNRYPDQNNPGRVPNGWDDWQAIFFPEVYNEYMMNENGKIIYHGDRDEDYQTDVLLAKAKDFISKTPKSQPFFLYLSPFAPHAPAEPASRHENLFPDYKAPRTPSYDEADISDKPAWVRTHPRMSAAIVKHTDEWARHRLQTLQAVDEMLKSLLELLAARGDLDNTYVFFTSDNGFQLGAHRLDHGKGDPYEESIRVPLVVRGPGVPAGRSVDHFVLNIDFAPTFVALAGAPAQEKVDGASFTEVLGSEPPAVEAWRRDFLVEHFESGKQRDPSDEHGGDEDGGIPAYSALRTLDRIYVEYPGTKEREYYDLKNDPFELESIHDEVRTGILKRLQERLAELSSCAGAGCRSEAPLLPAPKR
jgi:arylsulfatase A-like enzyme